MKNVIVILLTSLALTSCVTEAEYTEFTVERLIEWHDDKYNQTCWVLAHSHQAAITCTPDWMLTQGEQ